MQVTNYTKQNRPLKANKSRGSQKVRILWNQKVRAVFKRTRHLDRSWTRRIQRTPFFPLPLRASWYHPPNHTYVFQVVSLFESPGKETLWTIPPYVPRLSHLPWRHHRNILWVGIKKLLIMPFSLAPVTSSLQFLRPNISLGTLFWNNLSLCPVLNVRTKFHTY